VTILHTEVTYIMLHTFIFVEEVDSLMSPLL